MAIRKSRPRPSAGARGTAEARRKAAAFRAAEAARQRRRRITRWAAVTVGVLIVVAAVTIAGIASSHNGSGHSGGSAAAGGGAPTVSSTDAATATLTGPAGPEGVVLAQAPLLAPVTGAASGATVDGIRCDSSEQVAYHIHTHLSVFVNGSLRAVPPGIGVVQPVAQKTSNGAFVQASQCYYWLHTHAQDGVIHVEAPSQTTYTLGQFFAIWRQSLSATEVGPAHGTVTAFVNGHRFTANPATIPLVSHEDVQLDVGAPSVAPKKVDWSHSQL
jgi:hypothetical protein